MAQDFVGANNINLLVPSGQFGTRLTGGADAASPRYIFTYPSPVTRALFPEIDDALLDYCEDDGQLIEPQFYCPVIPLLLVNGTQGEVPFFLFRCLEKQAGLHPCRAPHFLFIFHFSLTFQRNWNWVEHEYSSSQSKRRVRLHPSEA